MELIDKKSLNFTDFEILMCDGDFAKAFKLICEKLDDAPIIEAEPVRRGRWVIEPGIGCKCSACGFDIGNDLDFMEYVNYCPNCGAKMDGREERWNK